MLTNQNNIVYKEYFSTKNQLKRGICILELSKNRKIIILGGCIMKKSAIFFLLTTIALAVTVSTASAKEVSKLSLSEPPVVQKITQRPDGKCSYPNRVIGPCPKPVTINGRKISPFR